jgi:hypothetical protein
MSNSGQIDKLDIKKWLTLAGITALVAVMDFVAKSVIPELEAIGGSTNALIALALTLGLDFLRRWLTPTNVVKPEDVNKISVDISKDETIPGKRLSIIDWVKNKF